MNWEAIKFIYREVLIYKRKIEYLSGDKYRLTSFYSTGEECWAEEFENRQYHGKCIYWNRNGRKVLNEEYRNGNRIKRIEKL